MASIDLDGIDEATARGVAELKKELAKEIDRLAPDWPDTVAIGRHRGGKSTMAKEALKRLTGVGSLALMDWNIRSHHEYRRPDGKKFRDSEFDGVLEYLIPDTILGKPVVTVRADPSSDRFGLRPMDVNLECDGGIKVQCTCIYADDRPYLVLVGYTEERHHFPHRFLGSDF